jgi:hypothetical protein
VAKKVAVRPTISLQVIEDNRKSFDGHPTAEHSKIRDEIQRT